MKAKTLLSLALAMSVLPAFAQDMMQPVPAEMKSLDYLVGHWEGPMTMFLGPGQEMKTTGHMDVEKILGGRYIREMFSYKMQDMDMSGMLLLTFEPEAKNWVSWWYDSSAFGASEFTGKPSGDNIVMTSKPGGMEMRSSWTKHSAKKATMKVEMKQGADWAVFINVELEKKPKS